MDKETLQSQLDKVSADERVIRSGIEERLAAVTKLQTEIEQHKGALSYNLILAEYLRKNLSELADKSEKAT